jgi:hypothetical protein
MIVIRTAEDWACALAAPPDPDLKHLLQTHHERLAAYDGYDLQELVLIIIVEPGDTLEALEDAFGERPVADSTFLIEPELIAQHHGWIEVVFILSDDGFGLVLFVSTAEGSDPNLVAACNQRLLRCP